MHSGSARSADSVLALSRHAAQVPPAAHDVDERLSFVAPPLAVVESMQARARACRRLFHAGSQPWRATPKDSSSRCSRYSKAAPTVAAGNGGIGRRPSPARDERVPKRVTCACRSASREGQSAIRLLAAMLRVPLEGSQVVPPAALSH